MYAIMKLEHEAPIYDDFDFGANFKRHIKSIVQTGLFQEKNKQGGLRIYFFEKSLNFFFSYPRKFCTKQSSTPGNSAKMSWIFCFFNFIFGKFGKIVLEFFVFLLYPWKFRTKQSSTPWKFGNIPWKIRGQKPRLHEIPHDFFLGTAGNSTSFLINPQKSYILFL